ncbi:hypothetical protein MKW92_033739 [Papaver armeniacum]|nr:hypothetical protein MKW92_033739 [Papaver armeniacum]
MAAAKFSIKTTSSFFLVLCLTVFTFPCFADPDELQDFCVADLNATTTLNGFPCKPVSEVTSSDFFYSGLMNEASTDNPLGLGMKVGDVNNFPGLNTLGLSVNRADFAIGGIIPLHTHPRASESIFVIKGQVLVGFISTSNVLYSKVLKVGDASYFNSQLPGTAILGNTIFGSNPAIPDDLLAKNFQVDEKVIATIKSKFGN